MPGAKTTEAAEQHVKFSTNVGYFDKYIEALECFRDEGILVFNSKQIFSKVVDTANVSMCVSRIQGQALNSLSVEGADELRTGLRFERIRECLKGTSNNSELEVTWPVVDAGSRLIRLDIIDEDLQFELSTLDPDSVPQIPQKEPLSHATRIVVDGSDMKKAVKHAQKIATANGGSVVFETYDGMFQLRASDKVEGHFSKQFHQSGPTNGAGLGEHQTEIALSYLDDINQVFGRGDEITVHIKEKNPIRFDVDLDDNGDAQVIYLIAPRLDDQG